MSLEILDQIINDLNEAAVNEEFAFSLLAQKAFDQTNTTFPRVVVRQLANRPRHIASADNQRDKEITTTLGYQFEFHAKDTLDRNDIAYDRMDVINILVDEVSAWLWENLGFIRNTWSPPTSSDDATARASLRVNGVLDRYGFIYKN